MACFLRLSLLISCKVTQRYFCFVCLTIRWYCKIPTRGSALQKFIDSNILWLCKTLEKNTNVKNNNFIAVATFVETHVNAVTNIWSTWSRTKRLNDADLRQLMWEWYKFFSSAVRVHKHVRIKSYCVLFLSWKYLQHCIGSFVGILCWLFYFCCIGRFWLFVGPWNSNNFLFWIGIGPPLNIKL